MRAQVSSPSALFDARVCYEIPTFQRPYVWDRDDQWEPLWRDIRRTAEAVLASPDDTPADELASHFLGAVVLKQLRSSATEVNR